MTSPSKSPSAEQKLAAVIEAQVRGGYDEWEFLLAGMERFDSVTFPIIWVGNDNFHPLEILLDPEGLRAAYGDEPVAYGVSFHRPGELQKEAAFTLAPDADSFLGRRIPDSDGAWTDTPEWLAAAQDILHAWLSGGAEAAIQTAFDLLPPSQR